METELVTKKVNCGAVGFLVGATSSAVDGIPAVVPIGGTTEFLRHLARLDLIQVFERERLAAIQTLAESCG